MPALRVAAVANTAWNLYHYRLDLITALIKDGYEVYAFAPQDSYTEKLRAVGCITTHLPMGRFLEQTFNDCLSCLKLARALRKHKINLVLSFTAKANLICSFATPRKARLIANISGWGRLLNSDGSLSFTGNVVARIIITRAAKIFVQNKREI